MLKKINQVVALALVSCMVFEQSGFAQVAPQMVIPPYINGYVAADRFRPVQLRSMSFDEAHDTFSLLIDKGDVKKLSGVQFEKSTKKLMEYFRTGIALPNSVFWVNLRPDSPDDVIDPALEKTDLGKVLLEADLQLKKDMARFTSPQTEEGRHYWDKLYARVEERFGQEDISIPTLTRPWIVPGEIIIRQSQESAYIYKASLNVMLEQDYLKGQAQYNFDDPRLKEINEYSSELIRTLVLPKLIREVNSSKKYASLRQVYYSLLLAQWFKGQANARGPQDTRHTSHVQSDPLFSKIDSGDLTRLTSAKKWSRQKYFNAYKKSFAKGEYNISETVAGLGGATVRQYLSGGIMFTAKDMLPSAQNSPVGAGMTIAAQPETASSVIDYSLIRAQATPEGTITASNIAATPAAMADGGTVYDQARKLVDTIIKMPGSMRTDERVAKELDAYPDLKTKEGLNEINGLIKARNLKYSLVIIPAAFITAFVGASIFMNYLDPVFFAELYNSLPFAESLSSFVSSHFVGVVASAALVWGAWKQGATNILEKQVDALLKGFPAEEEKAEAEKEEPKPPSLKSQVTLFIDQALGLAPFWKPLQPDKVEKMINNTEWLKDNQESLTLLVESSKERGSHGGTVFGIAVAAGILPAAILFFYSGEILFGGFFSVMGTAGLISSIYYYFVHVPRTKVIIDAANKRLDEIQPSQDGGTGQADDTADMPATASADGGRDNDGYEEWVKEEKLKRQLVFIKDLIRMHTDWTKSGPRFNLPIDALGRHYVKSTWVDLKEELEKEESGWRQNVVLMAVIGNLLAANVAIFALWRNAALIFIPAGIVISLFSIAALLGWRVLVPQEISELRYIRGLLQKVIDSYDQQAKDGGSVQKDDTADMPAAASADGGRREALDIIEALEAALASDKQRTKEHTKRILQMVWRLDEIGDDIALAVLRKITQEYNFWDDKWGESIRSAAFSAIDRMQRKDGGSVSNDVAEATSGGTLDARTQAFIASTRAIIVNEFFHFRGTIEPLFDALGHYLSGEPVDTGIVTYQWPRWRSPLHSVSGGNVSSLRYKRAARYPDPHMKVFTDKEGRLAGITFYIENLNDRFDSVTATAENKKAVVKFKRFKWAPQNDGEWLRWTISRQLFPESETENPVQSQEARGMDLQSEAAIDFVRQWLTSRIFPKVQRRIQLDADFKVGYDLNLPGDRINPMFNALKRYITSGTVDDGFSVKQPRLNAVSKLLFGVEQARLSYDQMHDTIVFFTDEQGRLKELTYDLFFPFTTDPKRWYSVPNAHPFGKHRYQINMTVGDRNIHITVVDINCEGGISRPSTKIVLYNGDFDMAEIPVSGAITSDRTADGGSVQKDDTADMPAAASADGGRREALDIIEALEAALASDKQLTKEHTKRILQMVWRLDEIGDDIALAVLRKITQEYNFWDDRWGKYIRSAAFSAINSIENKDGGSIQQADKASQPDLVSTNSQTISFIKEWLIGTTFPKAQGRIWWDESTARRVEPGAYFNPSEYQTVRQDLNLPGDRIKPILEALENYVTDGTVDTGFSVTRSRLDAVSRLISGKATARLVYKKTDDSIDFFTDRQGRLTKLVYRLYHPFDEAGPWTQHSFKRHPFSIRDYRLVVTLRDQKTHISLVDIAREKGATMRDTETTIFEGNFDVLDISAIAVQKGPIAQLRRQIQDRRYPWAEDLLLKLQRFKFEPTFVQELSSAVTPSIVSAEARGLRVLIADGSRPINLEAVSELQAGDILYTVNADGELQHQFIIVKVGTQGEEFIAADFSHSATFYQAQKYTVESFLHYFSPSGHRVYVIPSMEPVTILQNRYRGGGREEELHKPDAGTANNKDGGAPTEIEPGKTYALIRNSGYFKENFGDTNITIEGSIQRVTTTQTWEEAADMGHWACRVYRDRVNEGQVPSADTENVFYGKIGDLGVVVHISEVGQLVSSTRDGGDRAADDENVQKKLLGAIREDLYGPEIKLDAILSDEKTYYRLQTDPKQVTAALEKLKEAGPYLSLDILDHLSRLLLNESFIYRDSMWDSGVYRKITILAAEIIAQKRGFDEAEIDVLLGIVGQEIVSPSGHPQPDAIRAGKLLILGKTVAGEQIARVLTSMALREELTPDQLRVMDIILDEIAGSQADGGNERDRLEAIFADLSSAIEQGDIQRMYKSIGTLMLDDQGVNLQMVRLFDRLKDAINRDLRVRRYVAEVVLPQSIRKDSIVTVETEFLIQRLQAQAADDSTVVRKDGQITLDGDTQEKDLNDLRQHKKVSPSVSDNDLKRLIHDNSLAAEKRETRSDAEMAVLMGEAIRNLIGEGTARIRTMEEWSQLRRGDILLALEQSQGRLRVKKMVIFLGISGETMDDATIAYKRIVTEKSREGFLMTIGSELKEFSSYEQIRVIPVAEPVTMKDGGDRAADGASLVADLRKQIQEHQYPWAVQLQKDLLRFKSEPVLLRELSAAVTHAVMAAAEDELFLQIAEGTRTINPAALGELQPGDILLTLDANNKIQSKFIFVKLLDQKKQEFLAADISFYENVYQVQNYTIQSLMYHNLKVWAVPSIAPVTILRDNYRDGGDRAADDENAQKKLSGAIREKRYGPEIKLDAILSDGKTYYRLQPDPHQVTRALKKLKEAAPYLSLDILDDLSRLLLNESFIYRYSMWDSGVYREITILAAEIIAQKRGFDEAEIDVLLGIVGQEIVSPSGHPQSDAIRAGKLLILGKTVAGEQIARVLTSMALREELTPDQLRVMDIILDEIAGSQADGGSTNEVRTLREAVKQALLGQPDANNNKPPVSLGGIDFRSLPAVNQPGIGPAQAVAEAALTIPLAQLDKEWQDIQNKMAQGAMPYQELKNYVAVCSARKDAREQLKAAASCISNILKMEEERAIVTAPELKEILCCMG